MTLRWINGWVTLETIVKALTDNELCALDAYEENHTSPLFREERDRLRALEVEDEAER